MPPKAAPVPAAPVGKKVSVSVKIFKPVELEGGVDQPATQGLRLRVFTTWPDAISAVTTPIFGEKDGIAAWSALPSPVDGQDAANAGELLVSQLNYTFGKELKDIDAVRTFHEDCGVYFVFSYIQDTSIKLVNAFFLDCSVFLVDSSAPVALRCRVHEGYEAELSVSIEEPLMKWEDLLKLEPLIVRLKSINAFPIFPNETPKSAINGAYLCGSLSLGTSWAKSVLAFPSNAPKTPKSHSDSQTTKFPLDVKICCIPGLADLALFRDMMSSLTYSVELFQDDWVARAFSAENTKAYLALLEGEPGGLTLPAAPAAAPTAPPAGKKGAAPPKNAAPAATSALAPSAAQPSDKFLAKTLLDELARGKLIRAHGSARFRLEQLLDKSNDLLTKFRRKRGGASSDDEHVAVKEDMALEVRLAKPSKPEKWDLPADMSLLKALEQAKRGAPVAKDKNPPRHERFLVAGTTLSLCVEHHRPWDADALQFDSDCPIQTVRFGKTLPVGAALGATQGGATAQQSPSKTKSLENKANLSDDELAAILRDTPFTRMVLSMQYANDETLRALNAGINEINARALPDIQGSIRSYQLTDRERDAAQRGELDVLSGFMVLDDDRRLVVLEGLAAPGRAMETLYTDFLPRMSDNDANLSVLCNPEVLFPRREYAEFSPDIRRIRVRGKLKKLARRPEVYDRKQVSELCFSAIDALLALQRAEDLLSTKRLSLFPTAAALQQLELLYGEAISRADMDGTKKLEFVDAHMQREAFRQLKSSQSQRALRSSQSERGALTSDQGETTKTERKRDELQPTDCHNDEFEALLRSRPAHRVDYLAEQRALRHAAWRQKLRRQEDRQCLLTETMTKILGASAAHNDNDHGERENENALAMDGSGSSRTTSRSSTRDNAAQAMETTTMRAAPELPKVYLYSIQSENYKTKAWRELRHRVAADHGANYTLSREFLSQSISPVDEQDDKARNAELEKSHRLTQKGFQYPKPKTRAELIGHAKKPSDARVEDLQEPFQDANDRSLQANATKDAGLLARERAFKSQLKPESLFGALQPPLFQHEFQRKYMGDAERLPRGELLNAHMTDQGFFRSVHIAGEEQRKVLEESLRREKEDWEKKLVQSKPLVVGGLCVRDKAHAVDRDKDILQGPAQTAALRALREMTSHRGKDIGYRPAPLSMLSAEPFLSPRSAENGLAAQRGAPLNASVSLLRRERERERDTQPGSTTTTTTTGDSSGSPRFLQPAKSSSAALKDFTRYFNAHEAEPRSVALVSKRKHPPLDRETCAGPKWDAPQA